MDIVLKIKEELGVEKWQVEAAVKLIDEGNTIPFISRFTIEIGVMRKPFHVMAPQTLPRNDPFQGMVRRYAPLPTDRGQAYMRHPTVRFRSSSMPRNNPPLAERLDMS